MCIPRLYLSPTCGHTFMAIHTPCCPGMGFDHCPVFTKHGTILEWPAPINVPLRDCPQCGWRAGIYDMNLLRVVIKKSDGWKFGKDVHAWTKGVGLGCGGCEVM